MLPLIILCTPLKYGIILLFTCDSIASKSTAKYIIVSCGIPSATAASTAAVASLLPLSSEK